MEQMTTQNEIQNLSSYSTFLNFGLFSAWSNEQSSRFYDGEMVMHGKLLMTSSKEKLKT